MVQNRVLNSVASSLLDENLYAHARRVYMHLAARDHSRYGPRHWRVAYHQILAGRTLLLACQYEQAEAYFRARLAEHVPRRVVVRRVPAQVSPGHLHTRRW